MIAAETDTKKQLRVLVADCRQDTLISFRERLAEAGYLVDLVPDGAEAAAAARLKHDDVIFLDVDLPVMNGFEATRAIRRKTGMSTRVHIVGMATGDAEVRDTEWVGSGMDIFLRTSAALRTCVDIVQTLNQND